MNADETFPLVAAFDLSLTSTGYATGLEVYGRFLPPRTANKGFARLKWIRDKVVGKADGPLLVVLEGYGFAPQRGNAGRELAELGGVVRMGLYEAQIPYIDVPPATLKKYATGKGNAGKEEVLAAAIRRLNYSGHSNDEADALWLYCIGMDLIGVPIIDMPKGHRSALDKLFLPIEVPVDLESARKP